MDTPTPPTGDPPLHTPQNDLTGSHHPSQDILTKLTPLRSRQSSAKRPLSPLPLGEAAGRPQDSGIVTSVVPGGKAGSRPLTPQMSRNASKRTSKADLIARSGDEGVVPGLPVGGGAEMVLLKEMEVLKKVTGGKKEDGEVVDVGKGVAPLPPITGHAHQPVHSNAMLENHMIKTAKEAEGLPDFPHPQLPAYGEHGDEVDEGGVLKKKTTVRMARKGSQPLITRGGVGDAAHDKHKNHDSSLPTSPPHAKPTQNRPTSSATDRKPHPPLSKHNSQKHPHPPTSPQSPLPTSPHPPTTSHHPQQPLTPHQPNSHTTRPTTPSIPDDTPRNYNLLDFDIREQIGKGAFARVHLVRFHPRGDSSRLPPSQICRSGSTRITYAMKSLRKVDIVATKQVKHVMNEKTLLQSVRHPFIVNLLATFQDPKHLYLVMEYVAGGDMFTHLKKHRRFQEGVARFYTAEILLALEYIHAKDIVYRDLKPENILLGIDGHIKIADFGFAKRLRSDEKALTFCGTPAYMAPEIILKYGYTKSVDWWSLGIVCYELQAGYSPFQAETALKIYENIVDGEMRWSSQIGPVSKDLLKRLLEMTPLRRLGSGKGGAREIKEHPWFKGVDWKAFDAKEVAAPFIPTVAGEGDVSNFDVYSDVSSVIMMQNGTMEVTANDCLYDDVFKEF